MVGHSLGAGTAAILAMLLRPSYPDLFCYAFSPPGATLSLPAARYVRDFVISVVIGKDMIPRLSLYTMEDLRNKIMAVIKYSTTPKWKILRGCVCRCAFVCCYGCKCVNCDAQLRDSEADWEHFQLPNNKNSQTPPFFPPGKVIHVVKTVSVPGRCGRKGTIFEPVWADLQDFQTIQISGLMWEDHMPDFVLKALNQCLPSKEQEENVLSAPDPSFPNVLEVPLSPFVEPNHFHKQNNHIASRSLQEANAVYDTDDEVLARVISADSLASELNHPLWRVSALSSESRRAPIARPESGFEDSDLEESAPSSRVSATWASYTLPSVKQSTDNVVIDSHPRPRASTDLSESPISERFSKLQNDTRNATSSGSIPTNVSCTPRSNGVPPPKPPRTFETERSEGRQSFRYKPPPKPPRTYEYESQIQANFSSSLCWNFPRPRAQRYQTQFSSPDLDGSNLSSDSLDGAESGEVLPPYSPHRNRRQDEFTFRVINDHVNGDLRLEKENSSFSKQNCHLNGEVARRPKARSIESSGPESRFSVSDSGLHISQEEEFLLGSVKPRGGRRKRKPIKQAASEILQHSCPSADQPLITRRTDANFLETTL